MDRVPSGSLAEKDIVMVWFVWTWVGESWLMVGTGGRSRIVSDTVADPCPAGLVAVTLMVKVRVARFPVEP